MYQEKYCNCCGRKLRHAPETNMPMEDYVFIDKSWGYFSEKDGLRQKIVVCEKCFANWTRTFVRPPEELEDDEMVCY